MAGAPHHISVIIPNYNGGATIGECLQAVYGSEYRDFEVVVVDDCSTDNSVEIIKGFPCTLIRLDGRGGAARARNAGARVATGEVLFFIDADCLVQRGTLAAVCDAMAQHGGEPVVVGGTYTALPHRDAFFDTFQSIFINHFETKRCAPDYVATHAMAIRSRHFKAGGGFDEGFLPMLEDVELSHRLRRNGFTLAMSPQVRVRHIFDFSLGASLRNALQKTRYWTMYSLKNGDILADSGTASIELKVNGVSFVLNLLIVLLALALKSPALLLLSIIVSTANLSVNRRLLAAFMSAKGVSFTLPAAAYYTLLYPAAIWAGVAVGTIGYLVRRGAQWRSSRSHATARQLKMQRQHD